MAVAATSLITLAEAKLFPGMSNLAASDEAIIEALIDAASMDFEDFWDNFGIQRQVAEDYTYGEIVRGASGRFVAGEMVGNLTGDYRGGVNTIWLCKFPIVSVASIVDQAGNTIDPAWYWLDKLHGALRTIGGWIIPQNTSGFATYWTITYTAGRVASTADVPANIKLACKMWVAELYRNPNQNIQSKSVGDLHITYKNAPSNQGYSSIPPDHIRGRISSWKKEDA